MHHTHHLLLKQYSLKLILMSNTNTLITHSLTQTIHHHITISISHYPTSNNHTSTIIHSHLLSYNPRHSIHTQNTLLSLQIENRSRPQTHPHTYQNHIWKSINNYRSIPITHTINLTQSLNTLTSNTNTHTHTHTSNKLSSLISLFKHFTHSFT